MALPVVPAWIVDYATARDIFDHHAIALRQAVVAMCAAGTMKFCGCENSSFKKNAQLCVPFCQQNNCRCNLNAAIASTASALPGQVNGKKAHPSDHSAK